jgi:DNA-binding NarL/FixJ family response regulator
MSNDTIRVLLADDHAMVREGLRLLLRTASDIAIVGEAADGATTVALAQRFAPHVVVLDLDMPGSDGVMALRELQRTAPQVRVLILTMHAEQEHLVQLLETGARGYLTKDAASRDLVDAIRVVAGGEVYVRPTAARMLASAVVPQRAAETARGRFKTLSDREQTILRMVAQGYSGAEIARELHISSKTVDAYKHRIEDKLGLSHRTHYVRFGIEAGILSS